MCAIRSRAGKDARRTSHVLVTFRILYWLPKVPYHGGATTASLFVLGFGTFGKRDLYQLSTSLVATLHLEAICEACKSQVQYYCVYFDVNV